MNLTKKNKAYLIGGASIVIIIALLFLIGEVLLPFFFALYLAFILNPVILKIQTKIKNRNWAITTFLCTFIILFTTVVIFFGGHIIKDTKRLVNAVEVFTDEHQQQIDDVKNSIVGLVDKVYENEAVQSQLNKTDSTTAVKSEKDLVSTIGNVYSLFNKENKSNDEYQPRSWNYFVMVLYTLLYMVFILYTYTYFQRKYVKYFYKKEPTNKLLDGVWQDFKTGFLIYFKQRTKVVLINMLIFILAFSILDLPGAIIIGILAGVLTYASHFHYLSLPLIGIGCWVLSIEHDVSFFIYLGIILLVFIVISVLEETVYFNKIMKSVNGMNPAIMFLSFALWIYVFGAITGTIIALPLTQFIMIYLGRLILYSQEKRSKNTESNH